MNHKKGLFIVFEGIDGSGKSTQVKMLHSFMLENFGPTIMTCEPTKGPIGVIIRQVFSKKLVMDNKAVAGLFVADRLDHITNIETGMLQYLQKGVHVICDRYFLSSYAYQGAFTPKEWLVEANSYARKLLMPDITFYLNIKPETGLGRIHSDRDFKEIYETADTQQKVHDNYKEAIRKFKESDNIYQIDATRDKFLIAKEIESLIIPMAQSQ
ncbi:MAG: dTMP kinase [Saprospiraceae bacterium]|nr:dTMP kinase [Saprospiraceae bacterium]